MAKIIDNEFWLSPSEACARLEIGSKTLRRWAESGWANVSVVGRNGKRKLIKKKVNIEFTFSRLGHRFYRESSINKLNEQLERWTKL